MSSFTSFVVGLLLGTASVACTQGMQAAAAKARDYQADVAMCRANIPEEMCEEFVICQHAAQRAYGYPLTGSCLPRTQVDAGLDSSAGGVK